MSEQALSYLDFPLPRELQEADIYGARVHFRGRTVSARLPTRIATIVSRRRFDAYLLERAREAGAHIRDGERVSDVRQNPEGVEVIAGDHTLRARHCIVAAGANSRLATIVRPPPAKDEYAIAVEMDLPSPSDAVREFSDGLVDIHFGVAYMGYGWVFPHASWFNLGVAGIASGLSRARSVLDQFAETLAPEISGKLSRATNRVGAPIPAGGTHREFAERRILLAGDSAGFVDSFYGEGIAYAIRSGALAAGAVVSGRDPARLYARRCRREIVRSLRYSLYFTRLLHRFPGLLLKVFASHPQVLERFLAVPARKTSYQRYMRWFLPRVPWLLMTSR